MSLFTPKKSDTLKKLYSELTGLAIALQSVESLCKSKLLDFLLKYGKPLDIEHEQGVPHTAVDFSDENDDNEPKQKRIAGLYAKKMKIVAQFTDGTESDNFAFDDIGYLIDEIYIEYVIDDVEQDEANES